MKVLLFANDLMPFGSLPTSGGGLRCYQLMKGLESHGIEVVASMPGFTFLAERHHKDIPAPQRELLWRWETQETILREVRPDVVLFASNWDHFNVWRNDDVPVVIDLHGSRVLETTMWGAPVSADHKLRILSKADCLLTAGRRQRCYFNGWLVQAGRVPEHEHFIRYVPISLAPELPEHVHPDSTDRDAPRIVSGGGWFPWQHQAKAILAACREVAARDRGTIEIYGTPHETPNRSPEEQEIRDVYRRIQSLAEASPRIHARGYVGRDQLIRDYCRASVALETMRRNLERELAFTTRTIEYLWCGLPVLYNDYAEVAEHVREYDAGWTVDPDSDLQIAAAIEEIFDDPLALRRKGENAQRLVRDRFTWDETVLPLLDFVRNPRKAPRVDPVLGAVCVQPSYLDPRGASVDVPLLPGARLRQAFIVPSEAVSAIRVPFELSVGVDLRTAGRITLEVSRPSGRSLARCVYRGERLPRAGWLSVAFRWYRRPRAGERLVLEIKWDGSGAAGPGNVRGLLRAVFPLLRGEPGALRAHLLGKEVEVDALELHFSQAPSRLDRVVFLAGRAWLLLRTGQVSSLLRAMARRLPRLALRFRRLLGAAY